MNTLNALLVTVLALGLTLVGCTIEEYGTADARAYTEPTAVTVQAPPPQLKAAVEVRPPAPRPSAVWVAGYWSWSGATWVWMGGHWENPRPGYAWTAPVATAAPSGGVIYHPGYWRPERAAPPPVYREPGRVRVSVRPTTERVEVRSPEPQTTVVRVRSPEPRETVQVRTGEPPRNNGVVVRNNAPPRNNGVVVRNNAPPRNNGVVVRNNAPPRNNGVVVRNNGVPVRNQPPRNNGVVVRNQPPRNNGVLVRNDGVPVRNQPPRNNGVPVRNDNVPVRNQPPRNNGVVIRNQPPRNNGGLRGQDNHGQPPRGPEGPMRPNGAHPTPPHVARTTVLTCQMNTHRAPDGGLITLTAGGLQGGATVYIAGHIAAVEGQQGDQLRVRVPRGSASGPVSVRNAGRSANCGGLDIIHH